MSRIAKRQRVSVDDATTTAARPRQTVDRDQDATTRTTRTRRPATSTTRQRPAATLSESTTSSVILDSTSLESISEPIATSSADPALDGVNQASALPHPSSTSLSPTLIIVIGCAGGVALLLAALLVFCCQRKRKAAKKDSAGRVRLQDDPDTSFTSSKENDDSRDYSFGDEKNEKLSPYYGGATPITPTSPVPLLMFQDASPTSTTSPGFPPIRPARTPETLDILPTPSTPLTPSGNPLYHKFNKPSQTNEYQGMEDTLNTSGTSSSPPEYASQVNSRRPSENRVEQVGETEEVITVKEPRAKPKKDTIYGFAEAYGDSEDEDMPDPSRFSQAVGLARTMSKQESPAQGSRQPITASAAGRAPIVSQIAARQQKNAQIVLSSPPRAKLQLHKANSLEKNRNDKERTDYFGPDAGALTDGFPFPPTAAPAVPPTSASNNSLTSNSSYGPTPSTSANSIAQLSPTAMLPPVSPVEKTIGHAPAVEGYRQVHGPIMSVYSEMGHVEGSNSPVKNTFGSLGAPEPAIPSIPIIREEFVENTPKVRHSLAYHNSSPTPSENQAGFEIGQSILANSLESAPSSPEVGLKSPTPAINVIFPSPSPPSARAKKTDEGMVLGPDGRDVNGFVPLSQMSVKARQQNLDYRSPTMSIYNAYD